MDFIFGRRSITRREPAALIAAETGFEINRFSKQRKIFSSQDS
jgi:hypothetical protein